MVDIFSQFEVFCCLVRSHISTVCAHSCHKKSVHIGQNTGGGCCYAPTVQLPSIHTMLLSSCKNMLPRWLPTDLQSLPFVLLVSLCIQDRAAWFCDRVLNLSHCLAAPMCYGCLMFLWASQKRVWLSRSSVKNLSWKQISWCLWESTDFVSPVEILRQLPAGEESILLQGMCLMSCSSFESESEKTWPGSSGEGRMQTINTYVIKQSKMYATMDISH